MPPRTFSNTAKAGVLALESIINNELSWICRPQTEDDFGVDALIELTDDSRQVTGKLIAAQVKTGPSYLKDGDADAIWYYATDDELTYWDTYSVPVILVIHDPDARVTYWAVADKNVARKAKKRWRLSVPRAQVLSIVSKTDLVALAYRGESSPAGGAAPLVADDAEAVGDARAVGVAVEAAAEAGATRQQSEDLRTPVASPAPPQIDPIVLRALSGSPLKDVTLGQLLGMENARPVAASFSAPDADYKGEDPALHERINSLRDVKNSGAVKVAYDKLKELLPKVDPHTAPHAVFRVTTNIASAALSLGREEEAIAEWEAAHALEPENPLAIANLGMARLIAGDVKEAARLARDALAREPRPKPAATVLLQALARDDTWHGDPIAEIPDDIIDSPDAKLGVIEFLRIRDDEDWTRRAIEAAKEHPDEEAFGRLGALATLHRASPQGEWLPGDRGDVSREQLLDAGRYMRGLIENLMAQGFSDLSELEIHTNNAAVAFRLAGAPGEARDLLTRVIAAHGARPLLMKMLGIIQGIEGDFDAALESLSKAPDDGEAQLFRGEMLAAKDRRAGLDAVLAVPEEIIPEHHRMTRWLVAGSLALQLRDESVLRRAVEMLRGDDRRDIYADLFEIDWDAKTGGDLEEIKGRLRQTAEKVGDKTPLIDRLPLAEVLYRRELPFEASQVLEGVVDLSRSSDAGVLYLQALAAARRDQLFLQRLGEAAEELRSAPDVLETAAIHGFNTGDLPFAEAEARKLLAAQPNTLRPALLLFQILMRQNDAAGVRRLLAEPLESFASTSLAEQLKLARYLFASGERLRALAVSYRLFLENRDESRALMSLAIQTLESTRGDTPVPGDVAEVGPDAAVSVKFDDGTAATFIVEADAGLRKLDGQSWPPDHELVAATLGAKVGDRFSLSDGRAGEITALKHKYILRMQEILEVFPQRFSPQDGLQRVHVDVGADGGLDEVIAVAKARHDYVEGAVRDYEGGDVPLSLLALQIGVTTIDAADGLAQSGHKLINAVGSVAEREEASRVLTEHGDGGFVVDAQTFWTIWRLRAADALEAACGKMHIGPAVLDTLNAKREGLLSSSEEGLRQLGYADGALSYTEASPAQVQNVITDIDAAIAWLGEHAETCPVRVAEDLPPDTLRMMGEIQLNIFDEVLIARERQLLLLSDDLRLRRYARLFGVTKSAWLQWVLAHAADRQAISLETYVEWSAKLVGLGHSYVCVASLMFVVALRMAKAAGDNKLGWIYETLALSLGGAKAEPYSHLRVIGQVIASLWGASEFIDVREPATSVLLRRLVVERDDSAFLLNVLWAAFERHPGPREYLAGWVKGHFLDASFE